MKMRILLNFSGLVVILGLMLLATGCNGTSVQYDIPEPLVDETIYLSDPSSFNLTVIPMVWTSQFIGSKIIVLLIKIPTVN